jgi:hypothetical protein
MAMTMSRGWAAIVASGAMLLRGACSSDPETAAANDSAAAAPSAAAGDDAGPAPSAPGEAAPAPETASAGGAVADGSYSCHKISGSMLVNMGTVRVSGGQPDTSVLESVGAKFKGVESTAEGFRLSYESKSGWAEVMDCERE